MQHYCSQCGKLMDNDNNYICIDCFKKTNNLTDTNTEYTNTIYKNSNRVRNNDENKRVTEVKKVEIHLNNTKADDFLNFRNMDNKTKNDTTNKDNKNNYFDNNNNNINNDSNYRYNNTQYQNKNTFYFEKERKYKSLPILLIILVTAIGIVGSIYYKQWKEQRVPPNQNPITYFTKEQPTLSSEITLTGININVVANDNYSNIQVKLILYNKNGAIIKTQTLSGNNYKKGNTYCLKYEYTSLSEILEIDNIEYSIINYE